MLDAYFNRLIENLQAVKPGFKDRFRKFEDREKQYQYNVEELQQELTKLQQLNVNLQEAKTLQHILIQIAEAVHYMLECDRTLIFLHNNITNSLECHEARSNEPLDLQSLKVPVSPEGEFLPKLFKNAKCSTWRILIRESRSRIFFLLIISFFLFTRRQLSYCP